MVAWSQSTPPGTNRQLCFFSSTSSLLVATRPRTPRLPRYAFCLPCDLSSARGHTKSTVAAVLCNSASYAVEIWKLLSRSLLLRGIVYISTWDIWVAPSRFDTIRGRIYDERSLLPQSLERTHQEARRPPILLQYTHIHIEPSTIPS